MSSPGAEMPHQHVGPYEVISVLGRGASGTVYLAASGTRQVALKVVSRDPEATTRLLGEAEVLRKLNHPNVAVLLDYGEAEEGPYLAYEYVPGKSLEVLLNEGRRFSTAEILGILMGMASGLSAAHAQRIVHRDVKPSNIFISAPTDSISASSVRLLDFGVFGRLQSTNLTSTGQVFGTPLYMSPEQVRGLPQSPAADVYCWGLVAYELLFGKLPFTANDVMSLFVEKLSTEVRVSVRHNVPDSLGILVQECLRLDPARRPVSAAEVVQRLSRFKVETPTMIPQPESAEDASLMSKIRGEGRFGPPPESTSVAVPADAESRVMRSTATLNLRKVAGNSAARGRRLLIPLAAIVFVIALLIWLALHNPAGSRGGAGFQLNAWLSLFLGIAAAILLAF
jgi:serine/threonine protein kinase